MLDVDLYSSRWLLLSEAGAIVDVPANLHPRTRIRKLVVACDGMRIWQCPQPGQEDHFFKTVIPEPLSAYARCILKQGEDDVQDSIHNRQPELAGACRWAESLKSATRMKAEPRGLAAVSATARDQGSAVIFNLRSGDLQTFQVSGFEEVMLRTRLRSRKACFRRRHAAVQS
jgi:hypothetical protein